MRESEKGIKEVRRKKRDRVIARKRREEDIVKKWEKRKEW